MTIIEFYTYYNIAKCVYNIMPDRGNIYDYTYYKTISLISKL